MKRIMIIVLCLCLFLCGCTPKFSPEKGSVLDKKFIEAFPFDCSSFTTVVDWFEEQRNYKIEEVSSCDIYVNYRGNVGWRIWATNNDYYYDFVALFTLNEDYSEQDVLRIADCAVAELTDLCGNPVYTSDEGDSMLFYYGKLEIQIGYGRTITIKMEYSD